MLPRANNAIAAAVFIAAAAPLCLSACTEVWFETSPYAPRGVDAVYSGQEDTTFFSWRIRQEADLDRVDFEIYDGEDYRPIDLSEAPFSHEPYECDRLYYCFQYQLDGDHTPDDDIAAVRAVDARHGVFDSPPARVHRIGETIGLEPVGIENNEASRPQRYDWFDEEEIPLRRTFEWTLLPESNADDCRAAVADGWNALVDRIDLPRDWMNSTPCLAIRPDHRDGEGTQVVSRITPGAELHFEEIDLQIPPIDHPLLIGFLVDLEVASESRCHSYIDSIRDEIFSTLDELDADPDRERSISYRDMGTFAPIDDRGDERSPCDQSDGNRYPTGALLGQAAEHAESFEEPSVFVLVYLNNVDLEIPSGKVSDLERFFAHVPLEDLPSFSVPNPLRFPWMIGSSSVATQFSWAETTPWGALEDDNFLPSVESSVVANFPLRSRDFDDDDSIPLLEPHAADDPEYVRVCQFTPHPWAIRLPPSGASRTYDTDTWEWPGGGAPQLLFDLPPQQFVRFRSFHHTRATGAYEVCDAHCDGPFVSPDDNVRSSWLDASGVCRWE